jgi:hypothetical protein
MDFSIASSEEPAMKTRTKLIALGAAAALAAGVGSYAYTASAAGGFGPPFMQGWGGYGPGMMGGYGPGMMGAYGHGPGMMGYGYGPGPHGYFGRGAAPSNSGAQVDASKVAAAAKEQLGKATEGQNWTAPNGAQMTPILVDNQIVGQLWQSADLKTLEIGSFWQGPRGVNVQLLKSGEVVGMMWVSVS